LTRAASFLEPLPAWPVRAMCAALKEEMAASNSTLDALRAMAGVYYNSSGSTPCFDVHVDGTSDLGDSGWSFQACTEMVMPMAARGEGGDIFWPMAWDEAAYDAQCRATWGVTPRPLWAVEEWGGRDIR
jgi:lysosomal Pro-X carboxypeptidase